VKKPVTQADLIEAIADVVGRIQSDPGVTVHEYVAAQGISRSMARDRLERGAREGKLIRGLAHRPRSNGQLYPQSVYRPV